MQIILMSSVRKLGGPGSLVSVKNGFGRYLVQSGSALRASKQNIEQIEQHKEVLAKKQADLIVSLNAIVDLLKDRTLVFIRSAGSDGRLFGSVTKRDIADSAVKLLKTETQEKDLDINQSHILLSSPIKDLGCYKIKVSLHPDVEDFHVVASVAISEELSSIALKKFLSDTTAKEKS